MTARVTFLDDGGDDSDPDSSEYIRLASHDDKETCWTKVKHHLTFKEVMLAIVCVCLLAFCIQHRDFCGVVWNFLLKKCHAWGMWSTVPIALICLTQEVVGFPVDFMLVTAGAIFQSMYGSVKGLLLGIASCGIGVYFGCVLAFYLGRSLLKPRVQAYLEKFAMLRVINTIIETDGWKFAFVMRLSPLVPNEPLNYACALTSMSFRDNALATLGSIPKTAYEVWIGAQAASISSHSGRGGSQTSSNSGSTSLYAIIAMNVLVLAMMVVLCFVAKRKYDDHVSRSNHIEANIKTMMRRASTLASFNAMVTHAGRLSRTRRKSWCVTDDKRFGRQRTMSLEDDGADFAREVSPIDFASAFARQRTGSLDTLLSLNGGA